jgi:hypothetical protein
MELKTWETSNPMHSLEILDGRVLFLQRFAILMGEDGENHPLGEREAEEREKGSVAVKKEMCWHFDGPPMVYMGWFYHPEYLDICPEYPDRISGVSSSPLIREGFQ